MLQTNYHILHQGVTNRRHNLHHPFALVDSLRVLQVFKLLNDGRISFLRHNCRSLICRDEWQDFLCIEIVSFRSFEILLIKIIVCGVLVLSARILLLTLLAIISIGVIVFETHWRD